MPSRAIVDLDPEMRPMVDALLAGCERDGCKLMVTATYRSIDEQDTLYAQGRTAPGKIVTRAKGGYSWHNFRRAVDVVPVTPKGQPNWNCSDAVWRKVGAIGRSLGLEWGGDWAQFADRPHFQYTGGKSLAQMRAEYPHGC